MWQGCLPSDPAASTWGAAASPALQAAICPSITAGHNLQSLWKHPQHGMCCLRAAAGGRQSLPAPDMLFVAADRLCDLTLELVLPQMSGATLKTHHRSAADHRNGLACLGTLGLSKICLQVQDTQNCDTCNRTLIRPYRWEGGLTWGQGIGPALPSSHLRRLSTAESITVGMYTRLRQSVLSPRIVRSCAADSWCWTTSDRPGPLWEGPALQVCHEGVCRQVMRDMTATGKLKMGSRMPATSKLQQP